MLGDEVCPDVGQELWHLWCRRLGRLKDSLGWIELEKSLGEENLMRDLDGENLRRALKKGGPRPGWKGRRGDEHRWPE
ncbi:hypothetical protein TNCV_4410081 [Trichonephila clavipes]|nr:hypothetical protein TNCV_4410081 [Trichonephila clavipes]